MPTNISPAPRLEFTDGTVFASGTWQVQVLARPGAMDTLSVDKNKLTGDTSVRWDLSQITSIDHIGAQWLWDVWNGKRPQQLILAPLHDEFFRRLEVIGPLILPKPRGHRAFLIAVWDWMANMADHMLGLTMLIGQMIVDLTKFAKEPQRGPWKEISANIYRAGYQALGITALVAVLIGIVLSYLSSQQLHTFGGDIYIVNILGMSIIRELGPLLAAILVAGRSGSSITAQIGVMRVTEELDAMLVMGLPHGFRLIMPKVIALALVMPLLVIWTDIMALIGGMVAASLELNLSPAYFVQKLPDAVPLSNFWIGMGKGLVFGALIALVACHFGMRIKPNTESLGYNTTISVVTSITMVILADAVFAIVFKNVGFH
jgi:phospholipid/cholesterol/gamma-HCH transport system permease protein